MEGKKNGDSFLCKNLSNPIINKEKWVIKKSSCVGKVKI